MRPGRTDEATLSGAAGQRGRQGGSGAGADGTVGGGAVGKIPTTRLSQPRAMRCSRSSHKLICSCWAYEEASQAG